MSTRSRSPSPDGSRTMTPSSVSRSPKIRAAARKRQESFSSSNYSDYSDDSFHSDSESSRGAKKKNDNKSYSKTSTAISSTLISSTMNSSTLNSSTVRKGTKNAGKGPKKQAGGRTSKAVKSPRDNMEIVAKRMLSARRLKINELKNELETLQCALIELQNENKILKKQSRLQERALEKYEIQEGDMPNILSSHNEEIRALKEQLRRQKDKAQKNSRALREKEEEVTRNQKLLRKMKGLVEDKKLGERDTLARKLTKAESELDENEKKSKDLEKHIEHLKKNHKHELGIERARQREAQKQLDDMQENMRKLETQLKEKEKELEIKNIYSNRIMRPPHKLSSSRSSPMPPIPRPRVRTRSDSNPSVSMTPRDKAKMFEEKRREEERRMREKREAERQMREIEEKTYDPVEENSMDLASSSEKYYPNHTRSEPFRSQPVYRQRARKPKKTPNTFDFTTYEPKYARSKDIRKWNTKERNRVAQNSQFEKQPNGKIERALNLQRKASAPEYQRPRAFAASKPPLPKTTKPSTYDPPMASFDFSTYEPTVETPPPTKPHNTEHTPLSEGTTEVPLLKKPYNPEHTPLSGRRREAPLSQKTYYPEHTRISEHSRETTSTKKNYNPEHTPRIISDSFAANKKPISPILTQDQLRREQEEREREWAEERRREQEEQKKSNNAHDQRRREEADNYRQQQEQRDRAEIERREQLEEERQWKADRERQKQESEERERREREEKNQHERARREQEDRERLEREARERKEREERDQREREQREKREQEDIERKAEEERRRLGNDEAEKERRRQKDALLAKLQKMDTQDNKKKEYKFGQNIENMHNGLPAQETSPEKKKKKNLFDDDNDDDNSVGYNPSFTNNPIPQKKTTPSWMNSSSTSSMKNAAPSGKNNKKKNELMSDLFGTSDTPPKAEKESSDLDMFGNPKVNNTNSRNNTGRTSGKPAFGFDDEQPPSSNSHMLPRRGRQSATTIHNRPTVNAIDDFDDDIEEVML